MAEIRSTLDIIMEKTRGLTMTQAEKEAFKAEALAATVKGLVQRFLDGGFPIERLVEEVEDLAGQGKGREMVGRFVAEESIRQIRLGEDNETVLKILETLPGVDLVAIRAVLADFRKRLLLRREKEEQRLLRRFQEKGISGSAVVPNLYADREWAGVVARMKIELEATLRAAVAGRGPYSERLR